VPEGGWSGVPGVSNAVFLSYASEDAEVAERIATALRAAGVDVWFDKSELRSGDIWDRQIQNRIHDCRLFIPVISAHTERRDEGYFRREWGLAVDRTRDMAETKTFLVPVVVDETLERGASVPDKFRHVQWTRLSGGAASQEFIDRIAALLGTASASTTLPSPNLIRPAVARSEPGKRLRRWLWLWLAASLVAVGAGWVTWWYAVTRPPSEHGPSGSTSDTVANKSIAVLPFVDLSEKHDQEYFADGMAEEILDLLAKIPTLKVIGRTSSFQFKGKTGDLRNIAVALGVSYVVEGSVRRNGDHIRVTAQLVDAPSGVHRWSETYDRAFDDVLAVQREIASAVARELQVATGATESASTARRHDAQAYTLYLRGRLALDRGDRTSVAQAKRYFEEASTLDPNWVRPAEALAWANHIQVQYEFVPSREGWQQARLAAATALRIDPTSASGHAVLGQLYALDEYNWERAQTEFVTALRTDPNNVDALQLSANTLAALGRLREAIQREDEALTVDPLNPEALQSRAIWSYYLGDLESAERDLRSCLSVSPTYTYAHFALGQVLLARGDKEGALRETLKEAPEGDRDLGLADIYFVLGDKRGSDAAIARFTRQFGELDPYAVAQAHASRNENEQALEWLDRAYEARDSDLQFVRNDPLLEPIRRDPRYKAFLRKMNLPE
jgi:TolB-like protein/Flp pilus assembly protein TadD